MISLNKSGKDISGTEQKIFFSIFFSNIQFRLVAVRQQKSSCKLLNINMVMAMLMLFRDKGSDLSIQTYEMKNMRRTSYTKIPYCKLTNYCLVGAYIFLDIFHCNFIVSKQCCLIDNFHESHSADTSL